MNKYPALHSFGDQKIYRRAYWAWRGKLNIEAGLKWNGEDRIRKIDLTLLSVHGNKRRAIRNQQRAERFMAEGKTWRGTIPKRRPIAKKVKANWEKFRAEILSS